MTWKLALVALATMLPTLSAHAKVKADAAEISRLQSVAIVSVSFFRDVEMEPASPFKLKQDVIKLGPDDPEYIMIHETDARVLEVLQKMGSFDVLPKEEVFANEAYLAATNDPSKKLIQNWYYPEGYRSLKLKKENAKALCAALGVDAVVNIYFKHAVSGSTTNTLGMFGKEKKFVALKGEVTIFDKTGKKLMSGSLKSDKLLKSKSRSIGSQDGSGMAIQTAKQDAIPDEFYASLMNNYIGKLNAALGYE